MLTKTCLKIDFAVLNLSTRDLSYLNKQQVNRQLEKNCASLRKKYLIQNLEVKKEEWKNVSSNLILCVNKFFLTTVRKNFL